MLYVIRYTFNDDTVGLKLIRNVLLEMVFVVYKKNTSGVYECAH